VNNHQIRQHAPSALNRGSDKECQRQEHEEPPRDEPDIEDQRQCHVLRGMPRDDDTQRDPAIGPRVLQPPAG